MFWRSSISCCNSKLRRFKSCQACWTWCKAIELFSDSVLGTSGLFETEFAVTSRVWKARGIGKFAVIGRCGSSRRRSPERFWFWKSTVNLLSKCSFLGNKPNLPRFKLLDKLSEVRSSSRAFLRIASLTPAGLDSQFSSAVELSEWPGLAIRRVTATANRGVATANADSATSQLLPHQASIEVLGMPCTKTAAGFPAKLFRDLAATAWVWVPVCTFPTTNLPSAATADFSRDLSRSKSGNCWFFGFVCELAKTNLPSACGV